MSDKIYLKEITLPIVETGENETYSFVQTDADLDTAGDAADAKAVGDELTNLKQDFSKYNTEVLGLYPQMEVADTAVASFADGADDIPVKSLTVDITPVQSGSGDPSPSNVRPILGWTGANISVTGVNLYDATTYPLKEGWYINKSTGAPAQNANYDYTEDFIPVGGLRGQTIKWNCTDTGWSNPGLAFYDKNKQYISGARIFPVEVPTNAEYLRFTVAHGQTNIMLYIGDDPSTYEPYNGNTYSITFPTEAGTVYGGTLDVTNGVLSDTTDWAIAQADGTFKRKNGSSVVGSGYKTGGYVIYDIGETGSVIAGSCACNMYKNSDSTSGDKWCRVTNATNQAILSFRDTTISGWEEATSNAELFAAFTSYVASQYALGNILFVCWEKATPVTYQLTPTEVATILGQNNIFADTGNINELTYRADLKAYIDSHVGS